MTATAREHIAAGAAFLDEHDPGWWRADVERAIDLNKLDMFSLNDCILGQRCPPETARREDEGNPYAAMAEELSGLSWVNGDSLTDWSYDHGFTAGTRCFTGATSTELTAEWKRVIEARRAAA